MYSDHLKKPLSEQISAQINPISGKINLEWIKNNIGHNRIIERASHLGCGKTVMKSRRTREIYIPLIGSSQSYALNVIGTKINHLRQPFSTPEKDRKNKQKYILGLLSDELEDVDINTQFCLTRERDEIEFPSWPNQLRGIESRAEQMCFVKNEKIVGELLEELYQLWPKWNLRTRIIIDKRQNLNQVTIDKVVAFDKIPIWRKDDFLAKIKNALIGKLRLHSLIRDDFYTNVRKDLLFDWIGFFRDKKNRRCHRSLGELIEHVDQFIAQCTRITRFHWPLNICHLLLQNTSEWIHWIGEDSDLNIIKFFDSIASLQTQLLLRVVNQNYNNFFECQKEIFDHVNDTSIQQLDPDNDDQNGLSVYNIVKQISVISNEIPRCETKLFPDIFKNAGYLNCGNSTELPLFKIEYINIFKTLEEDFEKLYYDIDQFLMEPMNCDKWKMLCIRLRDYEKLLKLKTTKSFTNTFMFNFSNHKETLLGKCSDMVRLLRRNMDEFLSVRMKDIVTFYASSSAKLYGQNEINQICSIAQVKEKDLPRLKIKVNEVKVCFKVAQDLDLITETIVLKFHNVNQLPTKLFQLIELIQSILKVDQEDIEKEILMQAKEMYEDVTNLEREVHFTKRKYISSKYPNELAKVAARLEIAENKLLEIVDVFPLLQQRMDIFGLEPLDFDIYSLYKRAKVYGIFAKAHGPILEFYERTMNNHVMALNYLAFDEKLFIFKNKVEELRKEKEKHTESYILNVIDIAFGKMEGLIKECDELTPVLKMLCDGGIKKRHLESILRSTDNGNLDLELLTVKQLSLLNLKEQVDICEEIIDIANKESCLEETLNNMKHQWVDIGTVTSGVAFDNSIQSLLNEHIVKTQTILSSPFAKEIVVDLQEWLKTLHETAESIKLYKACILRWQTLEPLFVNDDVVVYQLPSEFRAFKIIDEKWRQICSKIILCEVTKMYSVFSDLNSMQMEMKKIQKAFDIYLHARRVNYPSRLFFLANTELLEMLAKYRNIKSVCCFLPKMFTSIHDLEFNQRGDIISVINENSEVLVLESDIKGSLAKSHLEKFLIQLDKEMVRSVRKRLAVLIKERSLTLNKPEEVIKSNLDQICLLYYRLVITHLIEDSINEDKLSSCREDFLKFKVTLMSLMNSSTEFDKRTVFFQTLLVEFDEYIDIISELQTNKVYLTDNLLWKQEIRYYWTNDSLFIRILYFSILYSFEFLSISQLIAPTNQIKKIWRHILYAQTQNYGAILYGPPATGKSESCKQLAAHLGKHFLSFNCAENVSRNQLEDLLAGTVLSGTFLCLDEFNRLPSEVMAWFANHVMGIYQAILTGSMKYTLKNFEMVLKSNFFIVVTMNLDKIGRFPIPVNITAAFKSIAARTPGLTTICQSYLDMNGFQNYKKISRLILDVAESLESILSPMKHYSFKLRTLFAVIKESIRLKNMQVDEFIAAKKAIILIIKPFITEKDVHVFLSVIKYSFVKKSDLKSIEEAISVTDENARVSEILDRIAKAYPFSFSDEFRSKCLEIYRISRLDKAILVLGHSISGKTTMIKIAAQIHHKLNFINVIIKVFNPSRFKHESIFGAYGAEHNEWIHGFLPSLLNKNLSYNEELWIVCDGLIDHAYAESLNSLIDSNNKLNLANGESVFLKPNIRIFFETDSVDKVAASTISRCRIVGTNHMEIKLDIPIYNKFDLVLKFFESYKFKNMSARNYYATKLISLLQIWQSVEEQYIEQIIVLVQYLFENLIIPSNVVFKDPKSKGSKTKLPLILNAKHKWIDTNNVISNFMTILLNIVLCSKQMAILIGACGVSKTTFLHNFVSNLDEQEWDIYQFNLTTKTTADNFLTSILETKLTRTSKNNYCIPGDRKMLIILNTLNAIEDSSRNSVWEFLRCFYDRDLIQQTSGKESSVNNVYFIGEFTTKYDDDVLQKIPDRIRRYIFPIRFVADIRLSRPSLTYNQYINDMEVATKNNKNVLFSELWYLSKYLAPHIKVFYDNIFKNLSYDQAKDVILFEKEKKELSQLKIDDVKVFFHKKKKEFEAINPLIYFPINESTIRRICLLYKSLLHSNYHSVLYAPSVSWNAEITCFSSYLGKFSFEMVHADATIRHWQEVLDKTLNIAVTDNKKVVLVIEDNIWDKKVLINIRGDLLQLVNYGLPLELYGPKAINKFADNFYMKNSIKPMSDKVNVDEKSEFKPTIVEWKKYLVVQKLLKKNLRIRIVESNNNKSSNLSNYCITEDWTNWTTEDFKEVGVSILEDSNEFVDIQAASFVNHLIKIHRLIATYDNKISPSNFINACLTFCFLCRKIRLSIETLESRYSAGIKKIGKSQEQVNFMQHQLLMLQPELFRTSLETTQLMSTIERETIEVENAKEVVAANEFKTNEAATQAQALKRACEDDLGEAIPVLEAAVAALQVTTQKEISFLKAMRFPPNGVRLCMEAVCILLDEKPGKVQTSDGKTKLDYWVTAQKLLSDMHFLQRIKEFQRDKVSARTINIIRHKYLSREEFESENIKASSLAAEGLCLWVRGVDTYYRISQFIEPKKIKLKKAEIEVRQQMKILDLKRKALIEITERLQKLSDQFSQMSQRKEDLLSNINSCESKINKTEKLINALNIEKKVWNGKIDELKNESEIYRTNLFVGAVAMEYISNWEDLKKNEMIDKISSIVDTKFKKKMLFELTSQYMNSFDKLESFIIPLTSRRVSLIFDAQGATSNTLRSIIGSDLVQLDCHQINFLEISTLIGEGKCVLINNVSEPIPLLIQQLCDPKFALLNDTKKIRLNNEYIAWNSAFRAILCTSNQATDFKDDFLRHVCCISISVNDEIIQDRLSFTLLSVLASNQMARKCYLDLERQKLTSQLKEIEANILTVLAKSKDLDNDTAIDMLSQMRIISTNIIEYEKEVSVIDAQLELRKSNYLEVISHACLIVKICMNLPTINVMYRRSLKFLLTLFQVSLSDKEIADVKDMKTAVSEYFKDSVGQFLFHPHKQIFAFLIDKIGEFSYFEGTLNIELLFREYEKFLIKVVDKQNSTSNINLMPIYKKREAYLFVFKTSVSNDFFLQSTLAANPNQKTTVISIEDIFNISLSKYIDEGQWLIIQNCQLGTTYQISKLNLLLTQLKNDYQTKILMNNNFRLFATVSSASTTVPSALFDNITAFALDIESQFTIGSFLNYCYTNETIIKIHNDQPKARIIVLKLCLLHFALIERSKFGIFGWTNASQFNLTLFDLISLIKNAISGTKIDSFDNIYRNVLELAYQGKIFDKCDLLTFTILSQYIFIGLNKVDNAAIDPLLQIDLNGDAEDVRNKLAEAITGQFSGLSGLHRSLVRLYNSRQISQSSEIIIKMIRKSSKGIQMTDVFSKKNITSDLCETKFDYIFEKSLPSSLGDKLAPMDHVTFCLNNEIDFLKSKIKDFPHIYLRIQYLQLILKAHKIRRIDLRKIMKPISLIEAVKLDFAKKFDCLLSDIHCYGTLTPPQTEHSLELSGCFLLGCTTDFNKHTMQCTLKELSPNDRPYMAVETVYVNLSSQNKVSTTSFSPILPKYHTSTKGINTLNDKKMHIKSTNSMEIQLYHHDIAINEHIPILSVSVNSNLPSEHWILRGVKLLTSQPDI